MQSVSVQDPGPFLSLDLGSVFLDLGLLEFSVNQLTKIFFYNYSKNSIIFKFLKFMATKTGITTNFSLFFVAPWIREGKIRNMANASLLVSDLHYFYPCAEMEVTKIILAKVHRKIHTIQCML